MMEKFEARFGFQMPLETQPSNKLLGQLKKMRRRKICEFLPLQKCTSAADQLTTEEKKHDVGPFSVMLKEDTKKQDFTSTHLHFLAALKIFCNGLILVSLEDNWFTLGGREFYLNHFERACSWDLKYGGLLNVT